MWTRSCVAVALLAMGAPAAAQPPLSEADALARLSTDSPRVRVIRAAVDLARADVLDAGRQSNPRVTFNRESVAGVSENILTFAQALPITGRRALEVGAATALIEASARRADDAVRRARAELRGAFADLAAVQVREEALTRARDRLRDFTQVLAKREAAGEAAGYDRLRAEREAMDLDVEWAAARADRLRAQSVLAGFFASPGDVTQIIVAATADQPRLPLPSVEDLLARARSTVGEPAALRQEVESAHLAERAADRRQVPEPELIIGTKSSSLAGASPGGVIGIHAIIPLFDRGEPERAKARARVVQAEARAAAFEASLVAETSALRSLVIDRRETADRYRSTAVAGSAELERIAQVSYDAGERGILELLDAYRSGAAARVRQAALDAAARHAEIDLELVSGWEIQ